MTKAPAEQTSPYALRLVGARAVAIRYSIALRTVDRWLSKKGIPPPDRLSTAGATGWSLTSTKPIARTPPTPPPSNPFRQA